MSEVVRYLKNEALTYVEGFGGLTYHDVKNSIQQGLYINKKYGSTRVLSDHTKVESVPEYVDIFNLGTLIAQLLKGHSIALIYSPEFREDYCLFEKSANARGCNIKLFEDKKPALEWLNCSEVDV